MASLVRPRGRLCEEGKVCLPLLSVFFNSSYVWRMFFGPLVQCAIANQLECVFDVGHDLLTKPPLHAPICSTSSLSSAGPVLSGSALFFASLCSLFFCGLKLVMLCRLLAGFLLVTSRRLAVLAQASTVVWNSPTPGDRFSSGNTIIGKWQTPEKVVSPSFGLCTAGENHCGATVWPEVKESAGYYLVSLAVPDVDKESAYYLRMKDDFGHTYSSPIFTLTSYLQNENNPATVPPDVVAQPQSGSDQAPMSPVTTPDTANPLNPASADPAAPYAPSPSSAAVPHPLATLGPLVAAAHSAPPAAALAVPLSLAGAIIVLAGGLALHHRRRLVAEKERARESSHAVPRDCAPPAWL
ncbi:hypothetical protein H4582DRAFT_378212 [Lactarius indigo]|nr:hypothetical protein H4582DRAFT_378212 [Lactarius indigo]